MKVVEHPQGQLEVPVEEGVLGQVLVEVRGATGTADACPAPEINAPAIIPSAISAATPTVHTRMTA